MSDDPAEVEQRMKKQIFVCGDGWLSVFDLLAPRKLGLEIAVVSQRFDCRVDEHFKTRRWALGFLRIGHKSDKSGAKEIQIKNSHANLLPIPHKALPNKVVGFAGIFLKGYHQNVIDFLHRFDRIFASFGASLTIRTYSDRTSELEFTFRNIWPMLNDNICCLDFGHSFVLRQCRQFVPSILSDCPSLQAISTSGDGSFPEFPPDDSADASTGQALAKWLFSPFSVDGTPKRLRCEYLPTSQWALVERLKEIFSAHTSPSLANFIIYFGFDYWSFRELAEVIVPFDLIDKLNGKRLTLKRSDEWTYLLIHCPIRRNEQLWAKWEEENVKWKSEAEKWNPIYICNIDNEADDDVQFDQSDFAAFIG